MAVAVRQVPTAVASPSLPGPGQAPLALQRVLPLLHHTLRATAPPPATRHGAMAAYHLGWRDAEGRPTTAGSGKHLRGCLALWAASACGGDPADALGVAAAVEWVHNFTLVHDDIQDGDRERRHRATVWAVWGSAQAINAGDAMHAVAYQALLSGPGQAAGRIRAARSLNDAILAVIAGQCLDLDLEGRVDTTISTYLRLARSKTGALIGAALEAGSIMGRAPAARSALLRRAGVELGVAFQVRDDWLGIWGDSSLTGKGCGDVARRKLTYPVVVALARLNGSARRELRRLYRRPDSQDALILALLDEAEAREAVAAEIEDRSSRTLELAQRSGLASAGMDELRDIVDFVARRES